MPFLTDMLARTQLMELRGEAVEVGEPHTAEAKAADTPRQSFSFVTSPCKICKLADDSPPPLFSPEIMCYIFVYTIIICNCEKQVVLYSIAQSQNIILICCTFGGM